jgi:hypothetical protein
MTRSLRRRCSSAFGRAKGEPSLSKSGRRLWKRRRAWKRSREGLRSRASRQRRGLRREHPRRPRPFTGRRWPGRSRSLRPGGGCPAGRSRNQASAKTACFQTDVNKGCEYNARSLLCSIIKSRIQISSSSLYRFGIASRAQASKDHSIYRAVHQSA